MCTKSYASYPALYLHKRSKHKDMTEPCEIHACVCVCVCVCVVGSCLHHVHVLWVQPYGLSLVAMYVCCLCNQTVGGSWLT